MSRVNYSNHPTIMGVRRLAAFVTSATKERAQFHGCCNGANISATLTSHPSFPSACEYPLLRTNLRVCSSAAAPGPAANSVRPLTT
jgi:hypothetical protein